MLTCQFLINVLSLLLFANAYSEKQAAVLARKMVNLGSNLHFNSLRSDGIPISMVEYYVSSDACTDVHELSNNGNPILLLSKMSTSYKNWRINDTVSVTIEKEKKSSFDSAMGKPRANFFGKLKELELEAADAKKLASHFVKRHPDARHWLPGDEESHVHDTIWFEFDVESVYFIGGFGDRAYIGNITGDVYHETLEQFQKPVSCGHRVPSDSDKGSNGMDQEFMHDSASSQPIYRNIFQFIKTMATVY